jgi:hypothetical protein
MDETKLWIYTRNVFDSRNIDNCKFCKNAIGKYSRARVFVYVRTYVRTYI